MDSVKLSHEGQDFVAQETGKQKLGLYDIKENEDGSVEVAMPSIGRAEIVGKGFTLPELQNRKYDSLEIAQQAIEDEKDRALFLKEILSLSKIKNYLFEVKPLENNRVLLVLPGAKSLDGKYFIGTYPQEYDSWQEAKQHLQSYFERESILTTGPILEIDLGDETKVSFSDLEAYDPKVAPTNQETKITEKIKKNLLTNNKIQISNTGSQTYHETIKDPDWQAKTFDFTKNYLENEGAQILEKYKIKDLSALTPKQAVMIATTMVIDLTKYKYSEAGRNKSEGPTKSDQTSALDLLQDGRQNKSDPKWQGNGVCRNFASMVKIVFDSLKANQTEFSQLNGTFALYEVGIDEYKPKRRNDGQTFSSDGGHAWNTFVTVNHDGSANSTIVDATWGNMNLETHEPEGVDYTLTRMEPMVYRIAQGLKSEDSGQLRKIIEYYHLKATSSGGAGSHATDAEQREFFVSQAMNLVRSFDPVEVIPPEFATLAVKEYELRSEKGKINVDDLEGLTKLWQANQALNIRPILDRYMEDHTSMSDYEITQHHYHLSNPELMKYVLMKFAEKPDFNETINKNPMVRHNVRELAPHLLNENAEADRLELIVLASDVSVFGVQRWTNESMDEVKEKINKVRNNLKNKYPEVYGEQAENLDDFQFVSQYERIKKVIEKS